MHQDGVKIGHRTNFTAASREWREYASSCSIFANKGQSAEIMLELAYLLSGEVP